jgi:hypothetical protein
LKSGKQKAVQFRRNKARYLRSPTAPELFPELINSKLDRYDRLPPSSALKALHQQEPFVNQTLACQALALARAAIPIWGVFRATAGS